MRVLDVLYVLIDNQNTMEVDGVIYQFVEYDKKQGADRCKQCAFRRKDACDYAPCASIERDDESIGIWAKSSSRLVRRKVQKEFRRAHKDEYIRRNFTLTQKQIDHLKRHGDRLSSSTLRALIERDIKSLEKRNLS